MLRRTRKWLRPGEDDLDPLAGVANLVDAMLVFACGLIVVLIISWNLHGIVFSKMSQKEKEEALSTISRVVQLRKGKELEEPPELAQGGGEGYREMGKVYLDPETGKLIMVTVEGAEGETTDNE